MAITEREILYLEPETAELLAQLVPREELHSQYVGALIRAAARQAVIEPPDGSAGLLYALASEAVLAEDWLGPEEDEAWRDLQAAM
ncbi:MAG: hypothetical protein M3Z04_18945 [Chloroflexota bacterium]|nr:hypothetical protein [Chloroflexota bacterium]